MTLNLFVKLIFFLCDSVNRERFPTSVSVLLTYGYLKHIIPSIVNSSGATSGLDYLIML